MIDLQGAIKEPTRLNIEPFWPKNGGGVGPLGNTTEFDYPGNVESAVFFLSKWRLQSIAQSILQWCELGKRTCGCMRYQLNDYTGVIYSKQQETAFYSGLMPCGSLWACPVCAIKVLARRAEEIRRALELNPDLTTVLVTYTLQHSRIDKLSDLMVDLRGTRKIDVIKFGRGKEMGALKYMLTGAARGRFYDKFGVLGYIRSMEIKHRFVHGWHPHVHDLFFLEAGCVPSDDEVKSHLIKRYGAYLRRKGYLVNRHTMDVQVRAPGPGRDALVEDYLTKSCVELELTGEVFKQGKSPDSLSPFQFLSAYGKAKDKVYHNLFRKYVEATFNRDKLRWSPGLREKLLPDDEELSDEEISENSITVQDRLMALLNRDEWRMVCNKNLRGKLLLVASLGDVGILRDWMVSNRIIESAKEHGMFVLAQMLDDFTRDDGNRNDI